MASNLGRNLIKFKRGSPFVFFRVLHESTQIISMSDVLLDGDLGIVFSGKTSKNILKQFSYISLNLFFINFNYNIMASNLGRNLKNSKGGPLLFFFSECFMKVLRSHPCLMCSKNT